MSKDKLHLLCGNRAGLHFFKRENATLDFQKIKSGVLSNYGVHSVFITMSGHIMAQETGSNDLILMKSSGEELARHKGVPAQDCGELVQKVESVNRNAFIGNIFSKIIWFKGKGDLAIVDLNDFSYKELKGVIPFVDEKSEATLTKAVHSKDCENICFIFLLENVWCIGLITKASKEPNIYLASDKFSKSSLFLLSEIRRCSSNQPRWYYIILCRLCFRR